jgi:RNA polymerase primary sigma factor
METKDKKIEVIDKLYALYQKNGYINEGDLFDTILELNLPLDEIDRVCDDILSLGIIIRYDNDDEDDLYDRSRLDYEEIFAKVVKIDEFLKPFIEEVRQIKPPQHREQQNIIKQAKAGNEYAKDRLILMHLKMVIRIALLYYERFDYNLEEAIQDGCIGLIHAYQRYETNRHNNFSSYVTWKVRQNIEYNADLCNGIHFSTKARGYFQDMISTIRNHNCIECGDFSICPSLLSIISEKLSCNCISDAAQCYYMVSKQYFSVEQILQDELERDVYTAFLIVNPLEIDDESEESNTSEKIKKLLSKLECSVLDLYSKGYKYSKIAEVLNRSEKCIDNTVQRIKSKAKELS